MSEAYECLSDDNKRKQYDALSAGSNAGNPFVGAEAQRKFQEVSEAYERLSDYNKRIQYDDFGSAGSNAGNPFAGEGFPGGGRKWNLRSGSC